MGKTATICFCIALLSALLSTSAAVKKSYIVYLGQHSHNSLDSVDRDAVTNAHYQFLADFLGSADKAKESVFYSYTNDINGFAAHLEEEEAAEIAKRPGVLSVIPNKLYSLHTTRSWQFLDQELDGKILPASLMEKAKQGEDVIIANIDTGVWPESKSFSDEGFGPVPAKWKGVCQNRTDIKCNKKLIGARFFYEGFTSQIPDFNPSELGFFSPRDSEGHGTHTLSTAGGNLVSNASLFGAANGTASGGSPKARVAAYKICWPAVPSKGARAGCTGADILAAFDAAIGDGVDVISGSIGGDPADYYDDTTAIGAFHAVMKGISVVMSAGNTGGQPYAVSNVAPWIFTIAASTQDRRFSTLLSLGDNMTLTGASLSEESLPKKLYPLASAQDVSFDHYNATAASLCIAESLDPVKTKGKIVVCLRGDNARVDKGGVVKKAGGVGMILCNAEQNGNELIADAHFIPAVHLTATDGQKVFDYIKSTKSPLAYIAPPSTTVDPKLPPVMAAFTSQGPNRINGEILKPDVTAPGVDILAAYTGAVSPTGLPTDPRRVEFNVMSGTSMSCPHVAGIVALVKKLHPDWSPAAIKSAIMTSAVRHKGIKEPIRNASLVEATPFYYGAGHVHPNGAADPGLVYDCGVEDYVKFLCANKYDSKMISQFTGKQHACPSVLPKVGDLNYPSIVFAGLTGKDSLSRTVKNVGTPGTYKVRIQTPPGVVIKVEPEILQFGKVGEEKSFKVTAQAHESAKGGYTYGRLIWSDGKHFVRSAIVVGVSK